MGPNPLPCLSVSGVPKDHFPSLTSPSIGKQLCRVSPLFKHPSPILLRSASFHFSHLLSILEPGFYAHLHPLPECSWQPVAPGPWDLQGGSGDCSPDGREAVASNRALGLANSKDRATANPAISTGKGLLGSRPCGNQQPGHHMREGPRIEGNPLAPQATLRHHGSAHLAEVGKEGNRQEVAQRKRTQQGPLSHSAPPPPTQEKQ